MADTLKDQLAADAVNVFLNDNEFAEETTYTPKSGSAITIKAIVDRQKPSPADENAGRVLQNQVEISIANDATYGVASINKGEDTVILPARIGGNVVTWVVADVLGQDDGMWHLLLQQ